MHAGVLTACGKMLTSDFPILLFLCLQNAKQGVGGASWSNTWGSHSKVAGAAGEQLHYARLWNFHTWIPYAKKIPTFPWASLFLFVPSSFSRPAGNRHISSSRSLNLSIDPELIQSPTDTRLGSGCALQEWDPAPPWAGWPAEPAEQQPQLMWPHRDKALQVAIHST